MKYRVYVEGQCVGVWDTRDKALKYATLIYPGQEFEILDDSDQ